MPKRLMRRQPVPVAHRVFSDRQARDQQHPPQGPVITVAVSPEQAPTGRIPAATPTAQFPTSPRSLSLTRF